MPDPSAFDRRTFVLAGLAAGTVLAAGPAAASTERAGAVDAVSGEAFAEAAARRALVAAAPVFVGDRVGTGSGSRLAMSLGRTVVRLGADARLTIDRFIAEKGGTLDLEAGALLFDRPEDAPKTPVRLRSPFGLVAVRGTEVFCGPSNGVYGVFVARGVVRVTAAGKSVTLGAGQGTNIAAPGQPPTDAVAWGQPRIAAAYASVR